jgi:hypothetical protein
MQRFKVTLEPPGDSDLDPIPITTPPLEPGEVWSLIVLAMKLRPTEDWAIHIQPLRS